MHRLFLLAAAVLLGGCAQAPLVDDGASRCGSGGCQDLTLHDLVADARDRDEAPAFLPEPALRIPGDRIEQAIVDVDDDGRPLLDVVLDEDSGRELQALSKSRIGKRMAVVIDGELLVAPYINGPFGPRLRISGFEHLPAAKRARARLLGIAD